VRLVVKQRELRPVHQRRKVALPALVAQVELVDVAQNNARAEQACPSTFLAAAQRREDEILRSAICPIRQQIAVFKDLPTGTKPALST
jgi:hypothetical protein